MLANIHILIYEFRESGLREQCIHITIVGDSVPNSFEAKLLITLFVSSQKAEKLYLSVVPA